jgi:hypothetical protein
MKKTDQAALQLITSITVFAAIQNAHINTILASLFSGASIFLPVAVFMLLYKALFFLYDRFLWRLVHRKHFLGGRWMYSLHNKVVDRRLYGIFTVEQGIVGARVVDGAVWFCGKLPEQTNQRGAWIAKSVSVFEDELQMLFEMKTLTLESSVEPEKVVHGTMLLNISREESSPSSMAGIFFSHHENQGMHGTVFAVRVPDCSSTKQQALVAYSWFGNSQYGTSIRPSTGSTTEALSFNREHAASCTFSQICLQRLPNIQMQKTGAEAWLQFICILPASDLERWTKPLRGRFNSQNLLSSVQYQLVHCYYS